MPSPCARSPSTAAPAAAPAASARPATENRRLQPYRQHQQKDDQRGKNQAEELPNGEELQMVELRGGIGDAARDGCIEHLPHVIAQVDAEVRRANFAGGRHLNALAGTKNGGTEYAPDRLGETAGSILRHWIWIGIAAVPGRCAPEPI